MLGLGRRRSLTPPLEVDGADDATDDVGSCLATEVDPFEPMLQPASRPASCAVFSLAGFDLGQAALLVPGAAAHSYFPPAAGGGGAAVDLTCDEQLPAHPWLALACPPPAVGQHRQTALQAQACASCPPTAAQLMPPPPPRPPPAHAPSADAAGSVAAGHTAALAARSTQREQTIARAGRLGLNGPLGDGVDHEWASTPSERAVARAKELYDHFQHCALHAASRSDSRLQSALTHFEAFDVEMEGRVHFKPVQGAERDANAQYNRATIGMFKSFVRTRPAIGKRARGDTVQADTADAYGQALYIYRSLHAGHCIFGTDADFVSGRAIKQMRLEDGPSTERELSRGVRATDLRAAFPYWDFGATDGLLDWALATWALNVVARGADPGVVTPRAVPDPAVDLMWAHFLFLGDATGSLPGPCTLTTMMVPSKDTEGRKQRAPVPIQQRPQVDGQGPDPVCAWHWVHEAFTSRKHLVPAGAEHTTLFFTHADGTPYSSRDMVRVGQQIARLAGWPAAEVATVGAKWARIGGASDYRDLLGEEGKAFLKRRGRWASDIADIYARTSLRELLTNSARVGDVEGHDLERAFPGWAQPATR